MIGIISDTHDNVVNIQKAMKVFEEKEVDFIVHCGDIVAPGTIKYFNGIHTKFVKGNCEGDIELIKEKLKEISGEYLGQIGDIKVNGKRIAAYHGDNKLILKLLIQSKLFDYIFTGHTHQKRDEKIGEVRIINPGAHFFGGENTVALLDTGSDSVEFVEVI